MVQAQDHVLRQGAGVGHKTTSLNGLARTVDVAVGIQRQGGGFVVQVERVLVLIQQLARFGKDAPIQL